MATPVKPSEFEALIPAADDTLCQSFVKSLIKFPLLFYRWYSYSFDESGRFNLGLARDICVARASCPDE